MDMPERGAINAHDVIRYVTGSSPPDSVLVSLRELDALFDQAPVAMTFLDRKLRVRRTNAAFRRLVSLPDKAIIGRRPSEFDNGVDAALMPGRTVASSARLDLNAAALPRLGTKNVDQVPSPVGNIVSPVNRYVSPPAPLS